MHTHRSELPLGVSLFLLLTGSDLGIRGAVLRSEPR